MKYACFQFWVVTINKMGDSWKLCGFELYEGPAFSWNIYCDTINDHWKSMYDDSEILPGINDYAEMAKIIACKIQGVELISTEFDTKHKYNRYVIKFVAIMMGTFLAYTWKDEEEHMITPSFATPDNVFATSSRKLKFLKSIYQFADDSPFVNPYADYVLSNYTAEIQEFALNLFAKL